MCEPRTNTISTRSWELSMTHRFSCYTTTRSVDVTMSTRFMLTFRGFPDFHIDLMQRHVSDEAIILEIIISGTHMNEWSGIPASGRRAQFPCCCVYPFDDNDRIRGERVYFDFALLRRQLEVLPPQ